MVLKEMAFTKISSKGQMVIPKEFRDTFSEGDKLIIIQEADALIIKNTKSLGKYFEDDIKFAQRVEEGWKDFDEGKYYTTDKDTFLEDMKKW